MLELPVLLRNVGTGQGQTEKRRHVPSWESLEANSTCRLSQPSLLGKGAGGPVSLFHQLTEMLPPTWVAVGQPGGTLSPKHLPQLGRQWLEPLPDHIICKPGVPVGMCWSTTPFPAFWENTCEWKRETFTLRALVMSPECTCKGFSPAPISLTSLPPLDSSHKLTTNPKWEWCLLCPGMSISGPLDQGSPTSEWWTGTGLWPVRNRTAQQELSGKGVSEASSVWRPHRSCYCLSSASCQFLQNGELYNYFIIYHDVIIIEIKWTINVMSLNHLEAPPTPSVHGKIVFHETSPWCQKGWGLLP